MRFEQIIAAVTRRLNLEGIRANTVVDGLAHAADLQLCLACVSPGMRMDPGSATTYAYQQRYGGHSSHPVHPNWRPAVAGVGTGKRKRLPLATRLLGTAKHGLASLVCRDN